MTLVPPNRKRWAEADEAAAATMNKTSQKQRLTRDIVGGPLGEL